MNYRVQFTNALAGVEIKSLHEQLHEIFQQILDETIGGVPLQVFFVDSLASPAFGILEDEITDVLNLLLRISPVNIIQL